MAQLFESDFQGSGGGTTGPSKRENLANYIALIDAKDTPFSSMAPKGKDLGNMYHRWSADQYEGATTEGFRDGKDATTIASQNATKTNVLGHDGGTSTESDPFISTTHGAAYEPLVMNHARQQDELSNYAQYFRRATKVSPLAAEVVTPVQSQNLLAAATAKKTVELKRDIEKTMLSNNHPVKETSSVPYKTRGMGSWVNNAPELAVHGSASTDADIPATFKTPLTSTFDISAGTGSELLTEEAIQGVLESIYDQTGTVRSYDLICGAKVKRGFTNLTATNTTAALVDGSDANHSATKVRTFNQELNNTTFKNTITVFEGDFGTLNIHVDNFMPEPNTGYIIPMEKTEIRYGMLPRVQNIPNSGSGEGRIVEAVASLVVKQPQAFGKFAANLATG